MRLSTLRQSNRNRVASIQVTQGRSRARVGRLILSKTSMQELSMSKQLSRKLSNVNRAPACFILALLFAATCASSARAQVSPPEWTRQGAQAQQQAAQNSQDDDDDEDGEVFTPPAAVDPSIGLRQAGCGDRKGKR